MIELLEPRVAPATLVSPTVLTYTDVDGDHVTVTLTKPLLTAANVNSVFTFSSGSVNGSNSAGQLLQKVNLEAFGAADGLGVTVIAKRGVSGDGLANVGALDARVGSGNGVDLGKVVIDGDLGQLQCGDESSPLPGLASLKTDSLGVLGTATQTNDSPALLIGVWGSAGTITVKGEAYTKISIDGGLGSLKIGGSLTAISPESGLVAGKVGSISIAGDLSQSVIAVGSVGSIFIGGDIRGSATLQGIISVAGGAKSVVVRGDVVGAPLAGGNGGNTGSIFFGGRVDSLTIGGSLIGKTVAGTLRAGVVSASAFGSVKIGGNIDGGRIEAVGTNNASDGADIGSVIVGGSLVGDQQGYSGSIIAGKFDGSNLPTKTGTLGKVVINGSLIGDSGGSYSTQVVSTGAMGKVSIRGDIMGAGGDHVGRVYSYSTLAKVTVGGSVKGQGAFSAQISAVQDIGAVLIGHDLTGEVGDSGKIESLQGSINKVKIGGSVRADFNGAGSILAGKNLGSVEIAGNLIGENFNAGRIFAGGSIDFVKIGGSLRGTGGPFAGSIAANGSIGSVTISGDLTGNNSNAGVIVARGKLNPSDEASAQAIGSVTVGGRIGAARILAGYSTDALTPVNADVQIGKIVCESWLASNAVAGVLDGGDGFGNGGDAAINSGGVSAIISKIGSVIIKSHARGTLTDSDSYGIVAQEIGMVKISDAVVNLIAGKGNDTDLTTPRLAIGTTGDFRIREVA